MRTIEVKGKTCAEAEAKALAELGLSRDAVKIEVIDEGESGGFLGIGRRPVVLRVTELEPGTDVSEEPIEETELVSSEAENASDREQDSEPEFGQKETAATEAGRQERASRRASSRPLPTLPEEEAAAFTEDFIRHILDMMGNEVEIEREEDEQHIRISVEGDDCGILIGRRGETLQALQYLSSLAMVKATGTHKRLQLDIGGYYRRRKSSLLTLAKRTAERALRTGSAYELSPMKSAERRIVHEALQSYEGIVTYSEGEEPNRYVVIDLCEEERDTESEQD